MNDKKGSMNKLKEENWLSANLLTSDMFDWLRVFFFIRFLLLV
jgi:hypothetical protein